MFTDREKQLIEKLKNNRCIFEKCTTEERNTFIKVGKQNCEYLSFVGKLIQWKFSPCGEFSKEDIYHIKPDFQIPDEFEDIEIKKIMYAGRKILGIETNGINLPLHEIVDMPNFRGFWIDRGAGFDIANLFYCVGPVAAHIDEGKTVYARLRR